MEYDKQAAKKRFSFRHNLDAFHGGRGEIPDANKQFTIEV